MLARKGNLHPTAMLHDQPAPLRCGETRPIRCACTQKQFAPYCCASASPLKCVYCCAAASPFEVCPETAAHKLYNCSSHSYSRFLLIIIDGRLHGCMGSHGIDGARLGCCCRFVHYNDDLKHSAGKICNIHKRQPFRPELHSARDVDRCNWYPAPQRPKLTYDQRTVVRYTIAPSTRQPVNVGLTQARPNYSEFMISRIFIPHSFIHSLAPSKKDCFIHTDASKRKCMQYYRHFIAHQQTIL